LGFNGAVAETSSQSERSGKVPEKELRPEPKREPITEKDLRHWQLLGAFEEAVERVFSNSKAKLAPSLIDPVRKVTYGRYLSMFLFGLCNPVVGSMRGLCTVSALERVQREIGGGRISPASFSEMQHVIDPDLLRAVFRDLVEGTDSSYKPDGRLAQLRVIAQDGSLWRALPRMMWAEYGVGRDGDAKGARLHLRFNIITGKPEDAKVDRGKSCERKALRQMCVPGQINVADRFYGEDYQIFSDVDKVGAAFVLRIKDNAVVHVHEEIPLTAADRAAGVVRHVWATLGATEAKRSMRVRLIEIRIPGQHLLLVTNLPVAEASAELVGLIYRKRWDIELFFRWIKCILGCRHLFAESAEGVAIQLYLALIASLLFLYYTGRRPNKRSMELIQMHMMGWATSEELAALLAKQVQTSGSPKKA
jgi:hypothetical protein